MTDVLRVDPVHPAADLIARAAGCLRGGGLVAFPTETVYGLGVHALDRGAVLKLFAAKGRPANDPLIVHVTAIEAAAGLVSAVPPAARQLAAQFWPGPLTLVMRRARAVPDEVTAGLDTVAIRVPAHPVARALIDAAGIPVAAPSANLFSRPSPTRAAHVLQDLDGRIDMVIDGGPTTVGVESTVLDLTSGTPAILRPGAVTLEMLRAILPNVEYAARPPRSEDQAMPAPGMLSKHYAPRAPLTLYRGEASKVAAAMAAEATDASAAGQTVGILERDDTTAERLYAALRELDALGVDVILACDLPSDDGLARAVRDRLRRAAARIVDIE